MLFDIGFIEDASHKGLSFRRHGSGGPRTARGYSRSLYFDARLEQGWLGVPSAK